MFTSFLPVVVTALPFITIILLVYHFGSKRLAKRLAIGLSIAVGAVVAITLATL